MSRRRQAVRKVPVTYTALLVACLLASGGSRALGARPDPTNLPIIDVQAWADDPELTLPSNQTTLRVQAHQVARGQNPLIYKWVKVDGPPSGTATFSPNAGDEDSDITTVVFSTDVAGTYILRVIIGNGSAETISEVEVTTEPAWQGSQPQTTWSIFGGDPSTAQHRVERIGGRAVSSRADRLIVRINEDFSPQVARGDGRAWGQRVEDLVSGTSGSLATLLCGEPDISNLG